MSAVTKTHTGLRHWRWRAHFSLWVWVARYQDTHPTQKHQFDSYHHKIGRLTGKVTNWEHSGRKGKTKRDSGVFGRYESTIILEPVVIIMAIC